MPRNFQLHDLPDELWQRITLTAKRLGMTNRAFVLIAARRMCELAERGELEPFTAELRKPRLPRL